MNVSGNYEFIKVYSGKQSGLIIKYFKNNKLQNIIWLLFSLHEIDTFLVYNENIYDYDIRILSFNGSCVCEEAKKYTNTFS